MFPEIREHLRNQLLHLIGQERRGEVIDRWVMVVPVLCQITVGCSASTGVQGQREDNVSDVDDTWNRQ